MDEEVWKRHLAQDVARDAEITRLRNDLTDMDAEIDRLLTRLQQIEEHLPEGNK